MTPFGGRERPRLHEQGCPHKCQRCSLVHDAAPTHHLFGWCTLRHLIRVLDIIQPDPSHPSRGWRIIAAGPEGPATPLGLATCVERRGKHLRAQGLSCPQRTICHGWWTRVLIHSSTTPSSVSGSLATPPDRQRTAGIHAAVAPRTTLGGCPTRRSHVWCFPSIRQQMFSCCP